jgi:aerobic-type carbon monoxide dehydrogenase small subunit (CoxS/CutS family)
MSEPLTFSLDGRAVSVVVDPKTPALTVLRDHLGVRSARPGCAPQGFCGCCAVLVDGKPRLTCTLPVRSLAGKVVTTLEGVPEEGRALLAASFVNAGAVQCGYCTPGIALSAWALLASDPHPDNEAILRALNLHTCRCTGYVSIVDAIGRAARGDVTPVRAEAADVVLAGRPYVEDIERPGMWHGVVVFAPAATGTIRRLELAPGGLALRAVGDELRHAGEIVAAYAAATEAEARAAASATILEVEPGLPPIEEDVARGRRVEGDPDALFADPAAVIVTREVYVAPSDPVFLEPEAALAVPEVDGVVVYSQGHDAAGEAKVLTDALGSTVRVRLVPSGGSYGGKEGILLQEIAARLALAVERPVRVTVGHEEGMRLHRRRPAARVSARAARVGDRVAIEVSARFEGGADTLGADRIVAQALAASPYAVDARIEVCVTRTDGAWTAPIRGAAGPVLVAIERALDALAEGDAWALRSRLLEPSAQRLAEALLPAWAPGSGLAFVRVDEGGGARVVIDVDGEHVQVQCNVPELGQGRDERLVRVLAEAMGRAPDTFTVEWARSEDVGAGAWGPVEVAARLAAEACTGDGRFVGVDPSRRGEGWAGCVATVVDGAVPRLTVAFTGDALGARVAEGAAHMAFGVALSEQVPTADGVPDGRFRVLGLLKARVSPEIVAIEVDGGEHEVGEAVAMATIAAVAGAVGEGDLPMRTSAAARAVGVRVR